MKYFTDEKIVIKSWCENPEEGAIEQAKNLANLPFAFKQICLMPDTHQGYGMPIGGVLATKDVVIPNAVGVDIGCGMCAARTSAAYINQETLKKILGGTKEYHGGIRSCIPVGFNHQSKKQDEKWMPLVTGSLPIVEQEYQSATKQVGTLGGGNHFIEIQKDEEGIIWIMLHSGSRNIGYKVADHYNNLAKTLNEKWHSSVPSKWDLAFFPIDSEEGQSYINEMNYCMNFALSNRLLMLERIKEVLDNFNISIDKEPINIAHNYASMENHFGKNVMIHRKGATLARENTIGIIPGSQGTSSYIVKGKGNPDSFMSCSHGAGRAMGRKQAERTLDLATEQKVLDDKSILHSIRGIHDLDEAAGAYKNIDKVMKEQEDLVKIIHKLEPLAVIKG